MNNGLLVRAGGTGLWWKGVGGGTRVQCRVTRRSLLGYFGGLFEALSRMSKSANELSVVPVHGRDLRSDVLCGAILI